MGELGERSIKGKAVRGPLRFPGGKSRAVPTIIGLLPSFEEYREPMIGGGSVFLSVKTLYPDCSYWINDYNHDIFSFWQACKEAPDILSKQVTRIKDSGKAGIDIFKELKYPETDQGDFERALRFYVLNRISFSGLVDAGGYSEESFKKRFTLNSINRIKHAGDLLKNVRVTNLSYEDVLREPGDDVFIYLDPPYFGNKNSKLYGERGILHTTFNHEKFRDELIKTSHRWLVTYDNSEIIKEWFSFANIYEGELSYGMNNAGKLKKAPKGKELFISNYRLKQQTLETFDLKSL